MFVAIFVVALIFAIIFHEFGHYATAKAFGMKVDKFFVGFGPTLWSFRRGETEYGVKGIPAGGFVRIIGMNHLEEVDPADEGRAFRDKAPWQRFIVLSAGSATHFLLAFLLLVAALWLVGLPYPGNTVGRVVADTPAAEAGIRPGDEIVVINGEATDDFDEVTTALKALPGETVELVVIRDGGQVTLTPTLATETPDGEPGAFLGVGPAAETRRYALGDAVVEATAGEFSVPVLFTQTVSSLGQAFSPEALSRWFNSIGDEGERDPNGPVSLVGVSQAVQQVGGQGDIFAVLAIFAQLNIVLGFLNMLPLPPFDGGHVAVLVVEDSVNRIRRLRGRRADWHIDPSVITPLALAVIVFFVVLSLTALYADIVNPLDITGG